jgi:valyl-tRNA synthetase
MFNASKFTFMHLEGYKPEETELRAVDRWILSKLNGVIRDSTESFEKYEYSKTKMRTEQFFWKMFCDYYLEIAKDRLYNPDKYGGKEGAQYTLYNTLLTCLKLMAPIMPYITEEVFQMFYAKSEGVKSVHISSWPEEKKDWIDKEAEEAGDLLAGILAAVRQFKQGRNISLGKEIEGLYLEPKDDKTKKLLEMVSLDLQGATRAKELKIEEGEGETVEFEGVGVRVKL